MSEDQPAVTAHQILAGLNQVKVESLDADPFKLSAKPAWRSAQAIDRALSYLDLALAEADNAVGKLGPHADAVFQAERAQESAAAAESEARLENSSYDRMVAARIAELASERAQLEQKKKSAPPEEIGAITANIAMIKIQEEAWKIETPMSVIGRELSADGQRRVREFNSALAGVNDTVHQQLMAILGELQQIQRRRQKAQARREMLRAGLLLGYAILVVVIGVLTDVALGHTKLASLWTSFIAATALWAIDRWLISPQVERSTRRRALNDLKEAVTQTVTSLQDFVRIGAALNQRATRAGLPEMELLSGKLMQ